MLPFSLAVRFLRAGKGQTVLIIAGIAIAVAAQIFIGLLIGSLQETLLNRTIGNQPQITITPAGNRLTIPDWQSIRSSVTGSGLVKLVGVTASGNAFVREGERTSPVLVRGVDAEAADIYGLQEALETGTMPGAGEALIGTGLQDEYGYSVGRTIDVATPGGSSASYTIAGIFDLGVAQLNNTWVVTGLDEARNLFGYGDDVTDIDITVNDYFAADTIATDLGALLPDTIRITNWKAENEQLLSGLQGQSLSSLMIQIFIIVSVVIAVAAILAITVFQKSRQLGILKAMGIKDRAASLIFIYEGLIIGVIGSILGIILGLLLLYGFSFGTSQSEGPALIDLTIDYTFIAISWVIAVAAAVLAALIPARRSLRLNPIEVIREG